MPELGKATYVVDLDSKKFEKGMGRAKKTARAATSDIDRDMRKMAKSWDRTTAGIDRTSRRTSIFGSVIDRAQRKMALWNTRVQFFRNLTRILRWPVVLSLGGLAIKSLAALTAGATALAGALTSAAGGLVAMAGAFGPILRLSALATNGLLGMAAVVASLGLGLSGIGDALGAMSKSQAQAGRDAQSMAKDQRAAARAIASAEEQLADAHRTVRDAQDDLHRSRREAIRDLIDLRFAAEEGALSEKRAAASLSEARSSLAEAITSGAGSAEVRSASIAVEEAELGLRQAKLENKRTQEELTEAEGKGVRRSDEVVEAKRALADAHRQVQSASRNLHEQQLDAIESLQETSSAVDTLREKMAALPPAAQQFVRFLFGLKPKLDELRATAAQGLLPGVERGITSSLKNFSIINRLIGVTSETLGGLAEEAGKLVGSDAFGSRLEAVGLSNARVLERVGDAGIMVADTLLVLAKAAAPLNEWIAKSVHQWARLWNQQTKADAASGKLTKKFQQTKEAIRAVGGSLSNMWHVLKNTLGAGADIGIRLWQSVKKWSGALRESTGSLEGQNRLKRYFERAAVALRLVTRLGGNLIAALINIGSAGRETGMELLRMLNRAAKRWREWTGSVEGRNQLKEYFDKVKPTVVELGRLVASITGGLARLGANQDIAPQLKLLRTDLLPAVINMFEEVSEHLGPSVIDFLVKFTEAWTKLAVESKALEVVFDALTLALEGLNVVLGNKLAAKTIAWSLALGAVYKASKLVWSLWKGMTVVKVASWLAGLGAAAMTSAGQVSAAESLKQAAIAKTNVELGKQKGLLIANSSGTVVGSTAGGVVGAGIGGGGGSKPGKFRTFAGKAAGKLGKAPVVGGAAAGLSSMLLSGGGAAGMGARLAAMAPAAGPWVALGAAIVAVGVGIVVLHKKWKAFRDFVKPVTDAFNDAFKEVKASVDELIGTFGELGSEMTGPGGLVTEGRELYKQFKGPIDAIGRVLKVQLLAPFKIVFEQVGNIIRTFGRILSGAIKMWTGVIQVFTGLLTGDFDKAWKGVKNIFSGGARIVVGTLRGMVQPFVSIGKRINEVMSAAFGGLWDRAKGIFKGGINSVIDMINKFLDLIGKLPFIPDDMEIGRIGGDGGRDRDARPDRKGKYAGTGAAQRRPGQPIVKARGGHISQGAPYGDTVPAMLERNEYVLNKNAVRAMGGPRVLDAINFGMAPRFSIGGWVGDRLGDAAGALTGAASDVLGKLPDPFDSMPPFFARMAKWVGDRMVDWVTGKDQKYKKKKAGAPSFSGPSAVGQGGGNIVKVGRWLQRMGYEVGEHPAFGGVAPVHTDGSAHYRAAAIDVNDDAPPFGHGSSEMASLDWLAPKLMRKPHSQIIWRNRDLDTGAVIPDHMDHLHFAMQRGGLVGQILQMAQGGSVAKTMGAVLLRNKLDIESSAGIMGNAWQESTWNPAAIEPGTHNGGLFGFTAGEKSLANMKAYASRQGVPWTNTKAQVQFMLHLLPQSMRNTMNRMSSYQDTTKYFMDEWERPLASAANLPRRLEGAAKAMPILKSLAGGAGGGRSGAEPKQPPIPKSVPVNRPGAQAGGGLEAPGASVSTEPLSFGPMPKSIAGCTREIVHRREQLSQYRRARKGVKDKRVQKALERNIGLLRRRIRNLIKLRSRLIRAKRKEQAIKKIRGQADFAFWNDEQTGRLPMLSRAWEKAEEYASQVVDVEPEEEEQARDWINTQEAPAYRSVLGVEETWRNSILAALMHGHNKIAQWREQITKITDRIKEIRGFKDTKPNAWKKYRDLIPVLKVKRNALRGNIQQTRSETIPAWNEQLDTVQGLDKTREFISPLPVEAVPGRFGGYIWDTQTTIRDLGLRLKQSEGAGGKKDLSDLWKQIAIESMQRERVTRNQSMAFASTFGTAGPVPAFGGVFHEGGVVPGRPGEERLILAESGEVVSQPESLVTRSTMLDGAYPQPVVIVEDGAVDASRIRVIYREEQSRDFSKSKRRVSTR